MVRKKTRRVKRGEGGKERKGENRERRQKKKEMGRKEKR